jgi:hypothetical protein
LRMPHDSQTQRGFTGTVRAHETMDLTRIER